MHISRLALDHYRSWDHCVLDFEPGINILQGSNGLGKTNIVEAVEVLSTGSSHRTSSSLPLIEKATLPPLSGPTSKMRANSAHMRSPSPREAPTGRAWTAENRNI